MEIQENAIFFLRVDVKEAVWISFEQLHQPIARFVWYKENLLNKTSRMEMDFGDCNQVEG